MSHTYSRSANSAVRHVAQLLLGFFVLSLTVTVHAQVGLGLPELGAETDPRAQFGAAPSSRPPEGMGRSPQVQVQVPGLPESKAIEPLSAEPYRAGLVSLERPIDPAEYLCGPGDVFEIHSWGQENLKLLVVADLEGRVFVEKLGFVEIAHKSLSEVRELIKTRLRKQYPGLSFDVSLRKPRTFLVHVVDNVERPGTYETQAVERLSKVLERARVKGSRRRITIRRAGGSELKADLVQYERTGDTQFNPFVLDGDVISVPAAELVVEVSGAVRHPGRYELVDSKDLKELFTVAGGFDSSVARDLPIQIVRRNADHRAQSNAVPFAAGEAPNAPLQDLDEVIVRSLAELQRTVLLFGPVEGADPMDGATSTKRLPYIEGDTVRSIVERAGGIKAPGDLKSAYISRPVAGQPPTLIPIDLEALLVRRELSADAPVLMGDEIVVPPMRRGVTVQGAVARAGIYPYNPHFGVPELIAHAGGFARNARSLSAVELIHPSGKTEPYREGIKVSPGDAVLVPERHFARSEIVSLCIAGGGLLLSGLTLALVVGNQ